MWMPILVAAILSAMCLAWYAWAAGQLRVRTAALARSSPEAPKSATFDLDRMRQILEAREGALAVSGRVREMLGHLGALSLEELLKQGVVPTLAAGDEGQGPALGPVDAGKAPAQVRYRIRRDYRIRYTRQTYLHTPFELSVAFKNPGGFKDRSGMVERKGAVDFEADEPEPVVRVELGLQEGQFEADRTSQETRLSAGDPETVVTFWLKPLKAEHCLVTVSICYPITVALPEKIEQIRVTTIDGAGGAQKTVTTKVIKPAGAACACTPLDQITLDVAVKSFLGMDAGTLSLLGKGLGALIAVMIVLVMLATRAEFGVAQAVPLGLLGVATPLGITVYDGLADA